MAYPEIILLLLTAASARPFGPTFGGHFSEEFPFREVAARVAAWTPDKTENVWELSGLHEGDIMLPAQQDGSSRNIILHEETRWPDATLPYYIDPIFSERQREVITGALREINESSCVKLIPYTRNKRSYNEKSLARSLPISHEDEEYRLFAERQKPANYIWFQSEPTGCWSMVGRQWGKGRSPLPKDYEEEDIDNDSVQDEHRNARSRKRNKRGLLGMGLDFLTGKKYRSPGPGGQVVNLQHPGCVHHGVVVHETLHALGFLHQQSAHNRDEFVRIEWDNISEGTQNNFQKYNTSLITDFGVEYDYSSVMHYGRTAFTKNGNDTITPLKEGKEIGQRKGLSTGDVEKLSRAYCKNTAEEEESHTESST